MRVLLTDASGLTSRQVATQVAARGHEVEILAPTPVALTRFTRNVAGLHRVPAYGRDPFGWLEVTLDLVRARRPDVLLATHEQVAVLAHEAERITDLGAGLAVPSFASLCRVQDKVAQAQTLRELALLHPPTVVVRDPADLDAVALPAFVKAPIGTASNAVVRVSSRRELDAAARELPVVVQQPAAGRLVMVQAVFDAGRLVAWHSSLREEEGASGGASLKRSVTVPQLATPLERMGTALGWHGPLSLDAILTADGPSIIDINPRLVEPGNAWHAGLDLVDLLLRISRGEHPEPRPPARAGVRTHQRLVAVLGAAQHSNSRRAIAKAAVRRHRYSTEELTPLSRDPLALLPLAAATAATLVRPAAHTWFTDSSVAAYALTPDAWQQIRQATP